MLGLCDGNALRQDKMETLLRNFTSANDDSIDRSASKDIYVDKILHLE